MEMAIQAKDILAGKACVCWSVKSRSIWKRFALGKTRRISDKPHFCRPQEFPANVFFPFIKTKNPAQLSKKGKKPRKAPPAALTHPASQSIGLLVSGK